MCVRVRVHVHQERKKTRTTQNWHDDQSTYAWPATDHENLKSVRVEKDVKRQEPRRLFISLPLTGTDISAWLRSLCMLLVRLLGAVLCFISPPPFYSTSTTASSFLPLLVCKSCFAFCCPLLLHQFSLIFAAVVVVVVVVVFHYLSHLHKTHRVSYRANFLL